MGIKLTSKNTKEGEVRFAFEEKFKRGDTGCGSGRHSIYEVDNGFKGEVPKTFRDIGLG